MPDESMPVVHTRQWTWSAKKARGAILLAQGIHTETQVAAMVGVHKETLFEWGRHPEFRERVEGHMIADTQIVLAQGIADRMVRIQELDDNFKRLQQIREERAAMNIEARESDADLEDVPGLTTGLVVRTEKMIGTGASATRVEEWKLDRDLIETSMALMKQAAIEAGQWSEKKEVTGKDGAPLLSVQDFRAALMEADRDDTLIIEAESRVVEP